MDTGTWEGLFRIVEQHDPSLSTKLLHALVHRTAPSNDSKEKEDGKDQGHRNSVG